jgi:hypothetical protein
MNNIKQYVQENKERFINELIELLKIPSVSADSAYSQDVIDTAEAVKIVYKKQVATMSKFVKLQVTQLFLANTLLIKICQPFWFMVIMMCNLQIR